VLLALLIVSAWSRISRNTEEVDQPMFEVRKGPLTISIIESGTIRAREQEIITSEVEGQTTLIYLVEEGMRVKEGDLLAELDASTLQDSLVEQQIRVQNAEAAFVRARETLAVTRNKSESDISLAELKYRFAIEDLDQYREGQYKQELMEAVSKIQLAQEELVVASNRLVWSEKLHDENYLSEADRDADKLALNRAELDVNLAKEDKKLLEHFTHKRQLAQLESDVDQEKQALARAKLEATADIVQGEAELKAKEAEWGQQQAKEKKIIEQIAKTKIVAPRDGLAVYATSAKASWRGNSEPLEAGQTVRERQELIYLPTADDMIAVLQIHESSLDKLRVGLPVVITVDALREGSRFTGKVARIAPLPDAASMWMNPDLKVYRTEVQIEGRQPTLRTGMSCMAEILVERHGDAVFLPVQAVLRVNGAPTVYVRKRGRFNPISIEVGMDNGSMIHVLSGIAAGQDVMLTPPLADAGASEESASSELESAGGELPAVTEGGGAATGLAGSHADNATDRPARGSEEMRKRFESMTPEQRSEMRKRREKSRGDSAAIGQGGGG
jgi:HlyD family secretion protein